MCLSYSFLIEDCSNTTNLVVNGGRILQNLLETSRSAFAVVKHCLFGIAIAIYVNRIISN